MTCATCEKIRRFVRNSAGQLVQRVAPFTEYEDDYGNLYVVAGRVIVGTQLATATAAVYHAQAVNIYPHPMRDHWLMTIQLPDGMAVGFEVKQTRKLFSNPYRT